MRIPFGFFGNLINSIIANFKNTVFANNGIFEAENYLYNILNSLMAYYNSFVVFITANAYEQNFLFAIKPTPITENYYLQTTASVFTSCCTTTKTFDVTANEFTITAEIEPYQGNEGVLEICGGSIGANWTFTYNSSGQFQLQLPGVSGTIVSTVTKTPIRIRQWVRVSKIASLTYNFFFSLDGINWTQVGGNAVMLAGGGPVTQNATANSTNINVGRGSGGSGCFIGKIYSCNFYTSGDPFAILPPLEIGMLSSLEEPGGGGVGVGTGLFANFKANEAPIGRYSTWASVLTGEVWSINQGNGNPQISNQGVALYTGGGSRFRTNSAGLLENVKKNLVVGSEFETGWSANGTGVSIVLADKSFVNYGINNGMRISMASNVAGIDSGIGGSSGSQSVTLTAGVQYAISFLFKVTGSTTKCGYYSSVASQISGVFDLVANTRTTAYSDNVTKNSFLIENLGNNVYRCTDVFTCNVSSNFTFLRLGFAVGSQTAGMEGAFGGLQIEVGNVRTAYQYTTTDAIYPRLDYTYGEPAILSEPASTNYALQSNNFNNGWTLTNMSVTPNQPNSLTGLNDATLLTLTGATGQILRYPTTGIPASTRITNSFYFKNVDATTFRVQISDGYNGEISVTYTVSGSSTPVYLSNTTSIYIINPTFSVKSVGNGWYKIINTYTLYSSPAVMTPSCLYVGNFGNGKKILIYGAQLEDKAFDTSYIPTTTATVTRVADSFNYINNSIINQTQGTLYFEFYFNGTNSANGFKGLIGISDVNGITNTDYIACAYNSDGSSLQVFLRSGNVNRVSSFFSSFANGINKIAIVFSPTLVTAYMNGVNMGSATPSNSPNSWAVTLDRIQIGNQVPILIKNIAYMPSATALTNSQLLALTT
jgi:hypothetical protein